MATLIAGEASGGLNILSPGEVPGRANALDIAYLYYLDWTQQSATFARGVLGDPVADPKAVYELYGTGFSYSQDGALTQGTLNRIAGIYDSKMIFDIREFAVSVADVGAWVNEAAFVDTRAGNNKFKQAVFAGSDTLTGSSGPDVLGGWAGDDRIQGNAGDDLFIGGSGRDQIEGGAGTDTAAYPYFANDYYFVQYGTTTGVLAATARAAGDAGIDKLVDVEKIYLSQSSGDLYGGATLALGNLINENFSPLEYVASYADLSAVFGTSNPAGAFDHYVYNGFNEGRRTTFDGLEYIASYSDLIAAFGANSDAGATHYITSGRSEGRTMSFDGLQYIASYGDLIKAFGANESAGASHYITNGRAEGRSATFDGLEYTASYGDLIAAFGTNEPAATQHYVANGYAEGRTVSFDGLQYIASYGDLIMAFGANSDAGSSHFITNGFAESRTPDTFNEVQYLANYTDLQQAFGVNNYEAATIHYITHGYAEGRTDHA